MRAIAGKTLMLTFLAAAALVSVGCQSERKPTAGDQNEQRQATTLADSNWKTETWVRCFPSN